MTQMSFMHQKWLELLILNQIYKQVCACVVAQELEYLKKKKKLKCFKINF